MEKLLTTPTSHGRLQLPVKSRDQPETPTENPSGNVRQHSGAFLLTAELFERANQIVACPITRAAHWRTSACEDANW